MASQRIRGNFPPSIITDQSWLNSTWFKNCCPYLFPSCETLHFVKCCVFCFCYWLFSFVQCCTSGPLYNIVLVLQFQLQYSQGTLPKIYLSGHFQAVTNNINYGSTPFRYCSSNFLVLSMLAYWNEIQGHLNVTQPSLILLVISLFSCCEDNDKLFSLFSAVMSRI